MICVNYTGSRLAEYVLRDVLWQFPIQLGWLDRISVPVSVAFEAALGVRFYGSATSEYRQRRTVAGCDQSVADSNTMYRAD